MKHNFCCCFAVNSLPKEIIMRRSLSIWPAVFLLTLASFSQAYAANRARNLKLDYAFLHAAASGDTMTIRRMAPRGPFLEVRDSQYGFTPLMWASWKANIGTMRELIKRGADVNARSNFAQPAPVVLMPYSVLSRDEQIVEGGSITTILGAGYAAYNKGITPLLLAAASGSTLAVQTLLDKGANPNAATVSGETPLDAAAAGGYLLSVQLLLKRGAKVNTQDASGATPLINAVLQGHTDIVKTLLNAGAEVKGTWQGYTPHRLAASFGRREIAAMLGRHEIDRILAKTTTSKPIKKAAPQRETVKVINADGSVQVFR
jgi:ankyrin repeat protein